MLSRAAERVYWAGRYLERAENSARIIQQYSQLFLDLPAEVGLQWSVLVRILGASTEYEATGASDDEHAVLNYLLADLHSPSSLGFSIRMARENVRNTRDLLPHECWETINEFYQFAVQQLPGAAAGENCFEVLADCIARCQQINGALTGTMSHRSPQHFLTLGQNIERADMTSRLIDVAGAYVRQKSPAMRLYGSTLWTNVLKSVSAFQMYRQYRQPQVQGLAVVEFLLRDDAFPRSIGVCLEQASCAARTLPRCENTVAALATANAVLDAGATKLVTANSISDLMDALQKQLDIVHNTVAATWFLPGSGK